MLLGGSQPDFLSGGTGDDELFSSVGRDFNRTADEARDVLRGDEGSDSFFLVGSEDALPGFDEDLDELASEGE